MNVINDVDAEKELSSKVNSLYKWRKKVKKKIRQEGRKTSLVFSLSLFDSVCSSRSNENTKVLLGSSTDGMKYSEGHFDYFHKKKYADDAVSLSLSLSSFAFVSKIRPAFQRTTISTADIQGRPRCCSSSFAAKYVDWKKSKSILSRASSRQSRNPLVMLCSLRWFIFFRSVSNWRDLYKSKKNNWCKNNFWSRLCLYRYSIFCYRYTFSSHLWPKLNRRVRRPELPLQVWRIPKNPRWNRRSSPFASFEDDLESVANNLADVPGPFDRTDAR